MVVVVRYGDHCIALASSFHAVVVVVLVYVPLRFLELYKYSSKIIRSSTPRRIKSSSTLTTLLSSHPPHQLSASSSSGQSG